LIIECGDEISNLDHNIYKVDKKEFDLMKFVTSENELVGKNCIGVFL